MAYDMPIVATPNTDAAPSESKANGHRHDLPAINMGAVYAATPQLQPGPDPQAVAAAMADCTRFHSARHHIDILTHRNACLEQKLAALTQQEMQTRYQALHDFLTGLPNRRLLEDRFQQAIAQATRHCRSLALLLLDVDGFKWVNDRLGHAIGDRLLKSLVRRLTAGIRSADTACRYGGDEFVLLLPEIDHPETATEVAAKVNTRLALPYFTSGYRIHISVSVGTAVYPFDGHTYEELMSHADGAMYRNKSRIAARGMSILMPLGHDVSGPDMPMGETDVSQFGDPSFFARHTAA